MSKEKENELEGTPLRRRLYAKAQKQEIVWLVFGAVNSFL